MCNSQLFQEKLALLSSLAEGIGNPITTINVRLYRLKEFFMGPRILLIEADVGLACALNTALKGEGYRTVTTTKGDEGLAKAGNEQFDVVLTALAGLGLCGLEVVRQLHVSKRKLPVI